MAGYTARLGLRPSPAKPAPRLCSALWAPPVAGKAGSSGSEHELAAVERLRESGGGCRLDPAQAQHRAEGVLAEPALVALGAEDRHEMGDLLLARLLVERHARV